MKEPEWNVGVKVLIEGELMSRIKRNASEDGSNPDYCMVSLRGSGKPIAVMAEAIREYVTPGFQLTDIDFDETRTAISRNIRLKRQRANLSQSALADLLGVSQNAVSQWETGVCVPRFYAVPSLARALKISIEELYEDVQNAA